ncbi:type II toxin-antitoxin system HipA family toxin [Actinomyces gaoshouyii]|uniref:Putative kinase Y4dM n=1 Tax=Actinomyces gaoshouyii TaxID=1960083 RepID=A0A8H9H6S8_9ACTO|nr:HipA domain-containing protein [Actinomyces gaoshouyii]GGO95211.1 putative kinase Y4dM [Actinomyces gaoshouyii]
MNEAVYAVLLHGKQVGSLQRRGDFTKFVFDADYWDRPHRMVLGRWFEDHPRKQQLATNSVPAWFSNLLPEGRLRDLIAREQAVSGYREMDLLERIGRDLPGAVSVVLDPAQPVDTSFDDAVSTSGREPVPVAGPRRASLAGMALKFSVRREGDRLAVPVHGEDGDWILKTPDQSFPGLPANERAVMSLARQVGIDVPEVDLWHRDDVDDLGPGAWPSQEPQAYAVRRFDRSPAGRIHIEDFAQVLGRHGAGRAKYLSNVETVLGLAYRGQDYDSLQEAVRRTVFNLLVGNGDAHLKNWSLIYPDGRRAQLSPAYDLVCTGAYEGHAELGLPFLKATRLADVGREHFARLQKELRVGDEDVLDVVDETVERFREAWAAGPDMPDAVTAWIAEHLNPTSRRLSA